MVCCVTPKRLFAIHGIPNPPISDNGSLYNRVLSRACRLVWIFPCDKLMVTSSDSQVKCATRTAQSLGKRGKDIFNALLILHINTALRLFIPGLTAYGMPTTNVATHPPMKSVS